MSRYMEIEIRLAPAYGSKGMGGDFPRLERLLREWGYLRAVEEPFSLYHLVDVLLRVERDPAVPDGEKGGVKGVAGRLRKARDQAREHLLARRLDDLDRTLYALEDLFGELEEELRW